MSTPNNDANAPAGQGQFERAAQELSIFLQGLGLPMSEQLVHHAASTRHEDVPSNSKHDEHHNCSECTRCYLPGEVSGTVTPIKPASERLCSLIPPANYGAVIPDTIYRSSYPHEDSFEFIKNLGIKSILTLVPEPISSQYQAFMDDAGIQHFHAHIKANKEGEVRIDNCEMSRALRLIMDRTNHPILIHCNKGKHRTGCTVACFRRIIGTKVEDVREEYHTYAGKKARLLDEIFFENFDLNLVMWVARNEGWIKSEGEIEVGVTHEKPGAMPPSPPASPPTPAQIAQAVVAVPFGMSTVVAAIPCNAELDK